MPSLIASAAALAVAIATSTAVPQTPPASGPAAPEARPAAPAAGPRSGTGKPTVTGGKSAGPVRMGPVVVDPSAVDFGVVAPNTTVETVVKLTNATDKPLRILASVPSCQCTSVDMKGVVIEPGSTAPMPMSMKTSGSTGEKMAGVKLMFEGYPDPVQVSIKSEVAYSIRASPPFLDVQQKPRNPKGEVEPARPLAGAFKLRSSDGKPFTILAVQGRTPAFKGFDPAKDTARAEYEVLYDFSATPADKVPCYLIVETDRADCPALDLRIRHENTHIKPAFKIGEYRSAVGKIAPGGTGSFDIEIKELKAARVASVTSKDPAQAAVSLAGQKPDGESVLVTCEVTPSGDRRGLLYFPVTITLDDGRKTDLWVFGRVG